MDLTSTAGTAMAMQRAQLGDQASLAAIKEQLQAQQAIAQVVTEGQQRVQAAPGPGKGHLVDISA